jgi:N-acetyl-anhydromuramyl-L-alanine amidase AmpD
MPNVPKNWMPVCAMKRIIVHWTGGGHKASAIDRADYHIIIEDDGKLVRGDHTIDDNVSTGDDDYAPHTKGLNAASIGISAACMAGAAESPFVAGPFPMTETQWKVMAEVAAELATFYGIPLTRKTILGHGEVRKILGVNQKQKWDPLVLPWNTGLTKAQAGDLFREEVGKHMA